MRKSSKLFAITTVSGILILATLRFLPETKKFARDAMKSATTMTSMARYSTKVTHKTSVPFDERTRLVFYNRIGKCGSRSLLGIVRALQTKNNFSCLQSGDFEHEHPTKQDVLKEIQKISSLKPPAFYNRHIHYLDFKASNYTPPIYINMVREPTERFVSQYNYMKHGDQFGGVLHPLKGLVEINECIKNEILVCGRNFTGLTFYMGMYFCGHDNACETQSKQRVELAKKHIDEEYAVIGSTDEFANTLLLLERMLPGYFNGSHLHWNSSNQRMKNLSTTKKLEPPLTEESKHKLRNDLLKDEYEVYHYAIAKFERLKKEHGIL